LSNQTERQVKQKAALELKIYKEEWEYNGIKFFSSVNITLLTVGIVSAVLSTIVIGDHCCNKWRRRGLED
jgi:hypothetical protein